MPTDSPIEPEGERLRVVLPEGISEEAAALVADMAAAWDEHQARERRFQVRMAEKSAAIGPSVEEALRAAAEIEALVGEFDPDLRIHGVKYLDEDGNRIDPSRVRSAHEDAGSGA